MMKRIYKEIKLLEDYYGKDKVEVSTFLGNEQHEYVINICKINVFFVM